MESQPKLEELVNEAQLSSGLNSQNRWTLELNAVQLELQ